MPALAHYFNYGTIEIDNPAAERALRGAALIAVFAGCHFSVGVCRQGGASGDAGGCGAVGEAEATFFK